MNTLKLLALALLLPGAAGFAEKKEIPVFSGDHQKYWLEVCARCHGVNGNGRNNDGSQLPDAGFDFTDSRKANRRKDDDWVRIILEGKDKMPAHKGKMTEEHARKMVQTILRPFAAKH